VELRFFLSGRELGADAILSSNDILSCDRTIKNEIKRLAAIISGVIALPPWNNIISNRVY